MAKQADRYAELRTRLTDAAERTIAEKGLAALRARDIAREAGCAVGTIYNVFEHLDELVLSVGYYNLSNAIAPDGNARGLVGGDTIWWSPDARFFFSATANLDVLFKDLTQPQARPPTAQAAR